MKATFGIFKGLHNGYGIYWQDKAYNVEGDGSFATIADARSSIDKHVEEQHKREYQAALDKVASGAIRADRIGDMVTVQLPTGTITVSIREYRNNVFLWEEKFDRDIVVFRDELQTTTKG